MAVDPKARSASDNLQFDRAVASSDAGGDQMTCGRCNAAIADQYYAVDGQVLCATCKQRVETEQRELIARGKSAGALILAALFGLGGAIAGAIIYWAVALTGWEIALVAIVSGLLVGGAIRKGASGAGGLRFQVLAAGLTYLSVGLAYTAILVGQAPSDATIPFTGMLYAVFALPVDVIVSSFPSGLISAAIIGFGIHQAWRMTGAHLREVTGPYAVGTRPPAPSV